MKKQTKLFFNFLLVLAVVFGLTACTEGKEKETQEKTEVVEPTEDFKPTKEPTKEPTVEKTKEPTKEPTVEKTKEPTKEPTVEPTIDLKEDVEAAMVEINKVDESLYSGAVLESLNSKKTEIINLINEAKTKEEILNHVKVYKEFVEGLKTSSQLETEALLNDFVYGENADFGNSRQYLSADKEGAILVDSLEVWSEFSMGKQDGNNFAAFDAYLTIDLGTDGVVTLKFRSWDSSTTYAVTIAKDKTVLEKRRWGVDPIILQETTAIDLTEKIHLQVLCSGWHKSVLVNDVNILEHEEPDFSVGRTGFECWKSALKIENMLYKEYENQEAFDKEYHDACFSPNILTKKSQAVKEINDLITNALVTTSQKEELKALVLEDINSINNVKTIEEIEPLKVSAIDKLNKKINEYGEASKLELKKASQQAFLDQSVLSNKDLFKINELGLITQESKDGGSLITASTQANNDHAVIEFDLTCDYKNIEYSFMTISFRKWDNNSRYRLELRDDSLTKIIDVWQEGPKKEFEEKDTDVTFKSGETHNVKIVCSGWSKRVFIDDVLCWNLEESRYTCGFFEIEGWEVAYTLDNVVSKTYQDQESLLKEYPELFD